MPEKDFGLQPDGREELNAKCNICGQGLGYAEIHLYGNRCVFCAEPLFRLSFPRMFIHCLYDWLIYVKMVRICLRYTAEDARMRYLGALGCIGFVDVNRIRSIKDKRALIKELAKIGGA